MTTHRMLCPLCAERWAHHVNPGCPFCLGHGYVILGRLDEAEPRVVARCVQLYLERGFPTEDPASRHPAGRWEAFARLRDALVDANFIFPAEPVPGPDVDDLAPRLRAVAGRTAAGAARQLIGGGDVEINGGGETDGPAPEHHDVQAAPVDELARRRRRKGA